MSSSDTDDYIRPPTPPRDPGVAALTARLQHSKAFAPPKTGAQKTDDEADDEADDEEDLSDSDLFAELEKDDDLTLANLREKRMEALKSELSRVRDLREKDHGHYAELTDEKEVIRATAQEARCVVHFYHRDFRRCQIMDKHLELIAPHHFGTRFIRVFVENVPWLVEKLQIKVLPCVVCFIGGVSKDRLIGFEELGNDDAFTTATLELRLAQSGVTQHQGSKINRLAGKYAKPSIRDRDPDDDKDWRSDE